ncbi:hypothetical protein HN51_032544 [Arachis hypogaea]|nr:Peroxidase [Arachis hypogaea]
MANLVTVFVVMGIIVSGFRIGADGLNMNYYFVESVVKDIVNRALEDDPSLAAPLLRMHFHDCFIQIINILTRSKIEDTINLPFPNLNAFDLIKMFGQHGFSAQEMVALSGAHTIGVARCSSFKNRLTKIDPNLNSEFAKTLSRTCSDGDNAEQPFDETRDDFDNLYIDALVSGNGVLASNQTLFTSPRTRNFVNSYTKPSLVLLGFSTSHGQNELA